MIGLIIGQLLVWALGAACVGALWRRNPAQGNSLVLGYGYVVGTVALTLWMRALSVVGIAWSWVSIGVPLLVGAAFAAWWVRRAGGTILQPIRLSPERVTYAGLSSRMSAAIWWLLVGLIALHLLLAGLEVIWRPLFPWDAWTQWATKARVWYEFSRMVPFADSATWMNGGVYTDAIPGYPANVPLLEVWACITLGRWDDSLMSVYVVFLTAALALAFHGQLRDSGRSPLVSLAGAYAVVSLPLLDTHSALAGYADLPLSIYVGLASIALWRWTISRDRAQFVVAFILAIACPFTKYPGWAWIGVMASALIVALWPRRGIVIVLGAIVASIVALAVLGHSNVSIGDYRMGAFRPVWEPLWQNYFQFANWHLLWYLLPVLIALGWRHTAKPPLIAGTAMVTSGLAFLFVVFSFSNAAAFVTDYSTVNRATLHLAPLLVFYVIQLADAIVVQPPDLAGARSITSDG